jgi:hypothetical protein
MPHTPEISGPAKPGDRPLDEDLYCLKCGYNLRGLTGDPVRCPECGFQNPLGDVVIPAEIIRAELRRMETAPALALTMALLLVPLPLLLAYAAVPKFDFACAATLIVAAVPAWITVALWFRHTCRGQAGWRSALLKYHLWGLFMIATSVGAFVGLVAVLVRVNVRTFPGGVDGVAIVFISGALLILAAVAFWARWVHRRLAAILAPLQRELAVKIAREHTRRRLARPHRRLFG